MVIFFSKDSMRQEEDSKAMDEKLLDRIGWYLDAVAGQCSTCMRKGYSCDKCIAQPAKRLSEELTRARELGHITCTLLPPVQDGRSNREQLPKLREHMKAMLQELNGEWVMASEIHSRMKENGFSGIQITRTVSYLIFKGFFESEGKTINRRVRWVKKEDVLI